MKKQALIEAVEKLGCTVEIDLEDGRYKTVIITAKPGHNFGGNHEMLTAWQSGPTAKLYEEALDDLRSSIIGMHKCTAENCGAWDEERNLCEFWQDV